MTPKEYWTDFLNAGWCFQEQATEQKSRSAYRILGAALHQGCRPRVKAYGWVCGCLTLAESTLPLQPSRRQQGFHAGGLPGRVGADKGFQLATLGPRAGAAHSPAGSWCGLHEPAADTEAQTPHRAPPSTPQSGTCSLQDVPPGEDRHGPKPGR